MLLASNVFAHSDNLKLMAENMKKLLKPDGKIVIEVQYLLNTIKDLTFDNIYHEHTNYWSLSTISVFLKNLDLVVYKAEKINTHGGSIRVYVSKNKNEKVDNSVFNLIKEEEEFGLRKIDTYINFGKKIEKLKENVLFNLKKLKSENKYLIGYGSPAKATTALNYFNIKDEIDYIVEDNPLKHNKFVPGVNIPIVPKEKCREQNPTILVLAWNFFEDIKKNNKVLSNNFISIKDLEDIKD